MSNKLEETFTCVYTYIEEEYNVREDIINTVDERIEKLKMMQNEFIGKEHSLENS